MKTWMWLLSPCLAAGVWAAPPPLAIEAGKRAADPSWTWAPLEVYAGDARVVHLDSRDARQLPRSDQQYFRLQSRDGAWIGVLTRDASGAFVAATVFGGTAIHRGELVTDGAGTSVRFRDLAEMLPSGLELTSSCGVKQAFVPSVLPSLAPPGESARATPTEPKGALVQARLAIDTDNEFMSEKFSNNTTAATNYISQLVALMSVLYERDLNVRFTIGTTILRTAPDPFVTDGSNTFAQLNEFGEFWRVNQIGVPRAFALQLSGKSANPFGASGIAWLLTGGSYCAATGQASGGNTSGHYSINQVFTFGGSTAANDVSLVAHELGHNFGANHTHCTDIVPGGTLQPIDMCFTGEQGCHSGPVSCPVETGGQGTLMSYCNFSPPSGAGCGQVRQEFHPFHITQLSARVLANTQNGCLTAVTATDLILINGFE